MRRCRSSKTERSWWTEVLARLFVSTLVVLFVVSIPGAARAQRVVLVQPENSDAVLVEAFNRLT